MTEVLFAAFLIVHGLIHGAIYTIPPKPDDKAPFDPGHSWVLAGFGVQARPARTASTTLAWIACGLFGLAGVLLLAGTGVWTVTALVAVVVGLVLKVGYFHRWLIFGVLLDLGILAAVLGQWPASLFG